MLRMMASLRLREKAQNELDSRVFLEITHASATFPLCRFPTGSCLSRFAACSLHFARLASALDVACSKSAIVFAKPYFCVSRSTSLLSCCFALAALAGRCADSLYASAWRASAASNNNNKSEHQTNKNLEAIMMCCSAHSSAAPLLYPTLCVSLRPSCSDWPGRRSIAPSRGHSGITGEYRR